MATVQVFFCHTCFADHKLGDTITLADGRSYKKAGLEKKKNEEEVDEYWVQCDHCESWVHQICGMFNKGRNSNDTHYLCPGCLLAGLESRRRERITVSGVPSPLLSFTDQTGALIPRQSTEKLPSGRFRISRGDALRSIPGSASWI